jgi:hypothetical protein
MIAGAPICYEQSGVTNTKISCPEGISLGKANGSLAPGCAAELLKRESPTAHAGSGAGGDTALAQCRNLSGTCA